MELAGRPLIGRLLCGKWRIERLLGSGGMSSVYAATHRNGKRVAVKVLSHELALNEAMRHRFVREGYIANRVGHPGAVSVLDDDATDDGILFLVMEFVDGENLEVYARRRGGRLPPSEVVNLIKPLLDVLVAAHRNGVIHRDIKPANVLVTTTGEVKLLDFGIASLRESSGAVIQTASGAILGTPAFMAPEQARGRRDEVDTRTDVWSVGATLFTLLSGMLVHERTTPQETAIAAATVPARSLDEVCSEAPPALVEVVNRALQLDPSQRFQTASDMLAALSALGAKGSSETRTAEVPLRARRIRFLLIAVAVAVAIAIAIAIAIGLVLTFSVQGPTPSTTSARVVAPIAIERVTLSPSGAEHSVAITSAGPASASATAAAKPAASAATKLPSAPAAGARTRSPSRPRQPPSAKERPAAPLVEPAPGAARSPELAPKLERILGSRR